MGDAKTPAGVHSEVVEAKAYVTALLSLLTPTEAQIAIDAFGLFQLLVPIEEKLTRALEAIEAEERAGYGRRGR